LPVRDPSRLAHISRAGSNKDLRFTGLFSYPFLDSLRRTLPPRMEVFSMGYQSVRSAILADAGGAEEKVRGQFVSGNAFNVLGVGAAIGRVLEPSDDLTPGAHPVAVISHAFWTRRFAENPNVLGSWIQVEQRAYQIVGVAQRGFTGVQPGVLTDVWVPNMMFQADALQAPNMNWLQVWGRLAPGETIKTVQAIARTASANFDDEQHKNGKRTADERESIVVQNASAGFSQLRYDFERPLLVIGAIVGLVLLIACSNVANLLLARGAARAREMALRASIGAGRGRLLQQILIQLLRCPGGHTRGRRTVCDSQLCRGAQNARDRHSPGAWRACGDYREGGRRPRRARRDHRCPHGSCGRSVFRELRPYISV
jgi:hypothetical protein